MPITVDVVSQVRQLYHTDAATMVIIPGSEGVMGVLPNHSALLTTMKYGELRIHEGSQVTSFAVYGGVVDVRPDRVIVLADDAESATEISQEEIDAARARAREVMAQSPTPQQREEMQRELRRVEIAAKVARRLDSPQRSIRSVDDH